MAQPKSRSKTSGDAVADARVGSGTRIRGRVSGDGNLVVEGRVEGNVTLSGVVRVAEGGAIEADVIEADALVVSGSASGELRVSGEVHATSGSDVRGNIVGGTLALDDGAHFEGRIDNEFSLPPELGGGATEQRRRR